MSMLFMNINEDFPKKQTMEIDGVKCMDQKTRKTDNCICQMKKQRQEHTANAMKLQGQNQ